HHTGLPSTDRKARKAGSGPETTLSGPRSSVTSSRASALLDFPRTGLACDRVPGPDHASDRSVGLAHDAQGLAVLRPRDRAPAIVRLLREDGRRLPIRSAVEARLELPLAPAED